MSIDLHEKSYFRNSLSPATRNATAQGVAVDLAVRGGVDDAVVVVITGTITDGSHVISVEESADGSTGWAAVPAGRIRGAAPTIVAANDDTAFAFGFEAAQRYVRVVTTVTPGATGGIYGAGIYVGDNRQVN